MPQIEISPETYAQITAYLPIARLLSEEEVTADEAAEVLILMGIDAMLRKLLESQSPQTLATNILHLAQRAPEVVHGYIAEVLQKGEESRLAEAREATRRFGLPTPAELTVAPAADAHESEAA